MKKLLTFVSAAVFSFSMVVASTAVATPAVASNQEMVAALVAANKAVAELSTQEVEAIVQALKEDGALSANNDTINALLEQMQSLSGTQIGSVTFGMLAVVAIAYYALPVLYKKAIKPVCGWVHGKYTHAKAARGKKGKPASLDVRDAKEE